MAIGPVMIDIQGTSLSDEDELILQHPLVGGVIYFSRNYESIEQLSALSAEIRRIRPEILIAVDQEGGRVQRFQEGFTRLPPMQVFAKHFRKRADPTLEIAQNCGWLMAAELAVVGIDFSFAPVLDVDDHHCAAIADRSFSNAPQEVAELGCAFMIGMRRAGMSTTGKHFPGHGSVIEDSHKTLPCDERSFAQIKKRDLIPFEQLTPSLDAVMSSHILFPKVDKHAASFSRFWLQKVLREELEFKGVIFSDDLNMEGAAVVGDYGERAKQAMEAGCNMVLICNNREGAHQVLNTLSGYPDLVKPNPQLERMHIRRGWTQQMIVDHERYQKALDGLAKIVAEP